MRMAWMAAKSVMNGKDAKAVEVGVERGINACEQLNNWNGLDLTLVDNYKGAEVRPPANKWTAAVNMMGAKWMIMKSEEAAKMFADESLDFVYIDADHSYEEVKKDIEAWHSKVKKGGVFGGHDYSEPSCGGVKLAVDEAFGDKVQFDSFKEDFSTDWWIIK
jgi:predicted O-methyltransferase YrrM